MRSKSHLGQDGVPDRGEHTGEKSMQKQVDKLLLRLQPTPVADERRRAVFEHVQEVVQLEVPDCKIFPVGSFPLKTYLPYADVDMVMFLPRRSASMSKSEGSTRRVGVASAWNGKGWSGEPGGEDGKTPGTGRRTALVAANQALCIAAASTKRRYFGRSPSRRLSVEAEKPEIRSVSFINARTPIVKMVVGNLVVDLTENQGGSVAAAALLEEADNLIQRDHLFKRSLLLLKAWAWCETPRLVGTRILGAQGGGLTSYGLSVMVLHLFAVKSSADTLVHPLDVLLRFFEVYSNFNWDRDCLTLDGPVPVESVCKPLPRGGFKSEIDPSSRLQPLVRKVLAELSPQIEKGQEQEMEREKKRKEKVKEKEKEKTGRRGRRPSRHTRSSDGHGEDSSSTHVDGVASSVLPPAPHFPKRPCNILDPLNALNNLGHSVVKPNLVALERALQQGREKLECWQLLSPASLSGVPRRDSRQRKPRKAETVRSRRSKGGRSAADSPGDGWTETGATARAGTAAEVEAGAGAEGGADEPRIGNRGHITDSTQPHAVFLEQQYNAPPRPSHHFAPPAQFVLLPPLHPAHPGPTLNGPSQPVLVSGAYPLATREGQPIVLAFPQPLLQAVPHQYQHVHQPPPYLMHQGQQGFLRPHSAVSVPATESRTHTEFWPQPQLRRVAYPGDHQLGPDQQRFAGRNMPPMGWSGQGTARSEMHGVVPEAEPRHTSAPRSEEVKESPIEHENHRGGRRKNFEEHHDQTMQRSMLPWDLPAFIDVSPTSSTASLSDFVEDGSKDGQDCQLQYESGADDDEVPGRPVKESLVSPFNGSEHGDAMVDTRRDERSGSNGAGTKRANGNLWTSSFLREFFPECCHRYGSGDGFREDLLDHPCQRTTKLQEPGSPLPRSPDAPDLLQGASGHAWDSLRMVGEMLREFGPEISGHRIVDVNADAGAEVEPSTANGRVDREEDGDVQLNGGGGAWGVRASNMAGVERRMAQVRRADAVAPSCDGGELPARLSSGSEVRGADGISRKRASAGLDNGDRPQRRHVDRPAADSVRTCADDETGYTTSEEQGDREDAMPSSPPSLPHDPRGGKSSEEAGPSLLPVETLPGANFFPVSTSTQALDSASDGRRRFGVVMQCAAPEFVDKEVQCLVPALKKMVSTASQCGAPGRISISTGIQCDIPVLEESRGSQCRSDATKQASVGVQCPLRLETSKTCTTTSATSPSVGVEMAVRGQGGVLDDSSEETCKRACDTDEELPRVSRPSSRPSDTAHSASSEAPIDLSVGTRVEETVGASRGKKKRKKGKVTGVAARSTSPEGVARRSPVALLVQRTRGVGVGDWIQQHLFWRGALFCVVVGLLLASVWATRGRAAEARWQAAGLLTPRMAHEGREMAAQAPVWVMVGGSLTLGDVLASRRAPTKKDGAGGVQWYKGDHALPGQTRPFLTISAARLEDEGTYACFAVEESGRESSRPLWQEATVRISEAPLVESQLQTQRLARGEMLAIVATASGIPQPEYQWRRNGVAIPGANRPMFLRHSVSEADMGTYTCDVYNVAGSARWEEMAVVLREEGAKSGTQGI